MFKETIETIKDKGSQIQEIISKALKTAKESYDKYVLEYESSKSKESPEKLLDLTQTYGGLIGMVDAGVYISKIEKDPKTAKASDYLMEVFKQFPEVEERFNKFIDEQEGLESSK